MKEGSVMAVKKRSDERRGIDSVVIVRVVARVGLSAGRLFRVVIKICDDDKKRERM